MSAPRVNTKTSAGKKNQGESSSTKNDDNREAFVSRMLSFWPKVTQEIGVSSILGAAVGVTSRRLTSDALYGTGLAFIVLQFLNFFGYIQINWKKVEMDAGKVLDQNGDNKLNQLDLKALMQRFILYVGQGVGDIGGFVTGFYFGARYLA
ncbi:hypothetical protein, conserved [Trypanosoma brucei gambiense DAL972]|uniref:FUN14 family n=2 Tax=Trypanosoma brucei TaxID=5691 RepID=C9ZR89_TRYB9|nr:hypothetical protein, conserved [Trypanosoma brucei gambiense DAL972]RHW72112.1 FUN14 family [Trypanosoma brucei equiperdum]CBH11919.1 hypothetical protein, conserved [Trypanosoma brucei gambiense DAL972]|eukprot:XP_011774204.1 hypothetical protein, conserved [Trypanosoma brucei gambiense DAL972]